MLKIIITYVLYLPSSRLVQDKTGVAGDLKVRTIYQEWHDAIKTRENQRHLLKIMIKIRDTRMHKYQSFYNYVLEKLSNISKLQTEALLYWITNGNLSHLTPDIEVYPNVTLTCLNPTLQTGRQFYADLEPGR